ncbi:MAG TPA: excinuclease ABC subunit UvrC [Microbacteriaceae bacterium]|nr:excinuclease ABC subunit UvrC [Microbacteriaceae bacterium]
METTDQRDLFRPGVGEVPTSPGVYRFNDRRGQPLYIGKAKNLRSRVSNYFQPLRSLPLRTQRMLQLAKSVDWTVVGTDTEALTLEHTWIREYQPPFNVQFRDDKTYPSLAITLKDEAPRLLITRNRKISGAKYYGPFPKVWALKQLSGALQEAFPIRTCNPADYARAMALGKPCLSGQIGRCYGPCSGKLGIEEHRERVNQMVSFLNGHDKKLVADLKSQMREASANLEFEKAAQLRDQLIGIQHVLEQNAMVLSEDLNIDVFGVASDETRATIHQFVIREGRIRSEYSWMVNFEIDSSEERLLELAIQSAYETREVPAMLLVPHMPASSDEIIEVLANKRKDRKPPTLNVPQRGEKRRVLDRAVLNAKEQLNRFKLKRATDLITRNDALSQIGEALGLDDPPMRIECVDVSHLQGTGVVASLVTFVDGLPRKNEYRTYRLKDENDDTRAIHEVLSRRAKQLMDPDNTDKRGAPDLFLIDGGQPQANAAFAALKEQGITNIAVCSIAKRLEEIWLPGADFPIIFARASEALFMLQRIRDEAHRFALTYQRKTRKSGLATTLTEIPGVGPARAKTLLQAFGSVAKIKKASIDEISEIKGIGSSLAEEIQRHLGSNTN